MNGLRLALRQMVFTNLAFWRNPANAFFTFFLPLVFLVTMNAMAVYLRRKFERRW